MGIYEYPRLRIGYVYLGEIIKALGAERLSGVQIVYNLGTQELVVNHDRILEVVKLLGIPYDYIEVTNAVKYIKNL